MYAYMMKPIYIFMQMMRKYINLFLVRQIKISYRMMSLSKLHDWSNTWLLSSNAQKCKVVS